MKKKTLLIFLILCCMAVSSYAGDVKYPVILDAMIKAGGVEYSHKKDYSKSIKDIYLGYDGNGDIIVGIALRKIRTYEKLTYLLTVLKKDDTYILEEVNIPDIDLIKEDEKKDKVLSSFKDLFGKILVDDKGEYHNIDAVSGATRYHKRVFSNYNFISKNIIKVIKKKPNWKKRSLGNES